jgi:hypothetical protein
MPIAKKNTSKEDNRVILKIYDFEIKKDTLYEIKEKLDTSAPEGFKEFNTTKVLSDTVVDTFPGAIYDEERGLWDTGLYPTSNALIRAITDPDARTLALTSLKKNIILPLEEEKGENILDHTPKNNAFWDKFRIECHRGKLFDTSKTEDLLKIFLLLLHKRVTPKEMESHPEFKQPISMYCIVDKDSSVSREAEKEMRKAKASALFYNLLNTDRTGLLQVLDYLGISASSTSDDAVLYTVFGSYMNSKEDKFQNDKLFIDTVDKYQTEEGLEEIYIHSKLKELYVKGKVKYKKGEIWMDDVFVESGWKNAARKVKEDQELKQIFATLIE